MAGELEVFNSPERAGIQAMIILLGFKSPVLSSEAAKSIRLIRILRRGKPG